MAGSSGTFLSRPWLILLAFGLVAIQCSEAQSSGQLMRQDGSSRLTDMRNAPENDALDWSHVASSSTAITHWKRTKRAIIHGSSLRSKSSHDDPPSFYSSRPWRLDDRRSLRDLVSPQRPGVRGAARAPRRWRSPSSSEERKDFLKRRLERLTQLRQRGRSVKKRRTSSTTHSTPRSSGYYKDFQNLGSQSRYAKISQRTLSPRPTSTEPATTTSTKSTTPTRSMSTSRPTKPKLANLQLDVFSNYGEGYMGKENADVDTENKPFAPSSDTDYGLMTTMSRVYDTISVGGGGISESYRSPAQEKDHSESGSFGKKEEARDKKRQSERKGVIDVFDRYLKTSGDDAIFVTARTTINPFIGATRALDYLSSYDSKPLPKVRPINVILTNKNESRVELHTSNSEPPINLLPTTKRVTDATPKSSSKPPDHPLQQPQQPIQRSRYPRIRSQSSTEQQSPLLVVRSSTEELKLTLTNTKALDVDADGNKGTDSSERERRLRRLRLWKRQRQEKRRTRHTGGRQSSRRGGFRAAATLGEAEKPTSQKGFEKSVRVDPPSDASPYGEIMASFATTSDSSTKEEKGEVDPPSDASPYDKIMASFASTTTSDSSTKEETGENRENGKTNTRLQSATLDAGTHSTVVMETERFATSIDRLDMEAAAAEEDAGSGDGSSGGEMIGRGGSVKANTRPFIRGLSQQAYHQRLNGRGREGYHGAGGRRTIGPLFDGQVNRREEKQTTENGTLNEMRNVSQTKVTNNASMVHTMSYQTSPSASRLPSSTTTITSSVQRRRSATSTLLTTTDPPSTTSTSTAKAPSKVRRRRPSRGSAAKRWRRRMRRRRRKLRKRKGKNRKPRRRGSMATALQSRPRSKTSSTKIKDTNSSPEEKKEKSPFVGYKTAYDFLSNHKGSKVHATNERTRESQELNRYMSEGMCEIFNKHFVPTRIGGKCE